MGTHARHSCCHRCLPPRARGWLSYYRMSLRKKGCELQDNFLVPTPNSGLNLVHNCRCPCAEHAHCNLYVEAAWCWNSPQEQVLSGLSFLMPDRCCSCLFLALESFLGCHLKKKWAIIVQ